MSFVRASFAAVLLLAGTVRAADIAWHADLAAGFAAAKADGKILMICVNAKYVDGRKTEERANKGLREVVYKDPQVVAKSAEFVCVLFTPGSKQEEFGELRALGIEGDIVSPQHIFVHPNGDRILLRKQYWSHGKGEAAIQAMLAMMAEAQEKLVDGDAPAETAPAAPVAGPDDGARPEWIAARLAEVRDGGAAERDAAIAALLAHDREGDCTTPLVALLDEFKKNDDALVVLVRALGRDGFHAAAPALAGLLGHKNEAVRGNAAVSLEYIGSSDRKVVAALRSAAGREKDEAIANHMYRALGRCGAADAKARSLLLKKSASGKSEFASYGPILGLAYFDGDAKAARGLEKILKKIGVPGGRRGGGGNTVKRGVLCWSLARIGDKRSATFVREELIAKLENVKAFWVDGLRSFYATVARQCDGEEVMGVIEQGIRGFVAFAKGGRLERYGAETRHLMDDYRKGRTAPFTPRGDNLLGDGE